MSEVIVILLERLGVFLILDLIRWEVSKLVVRCIVTTCFSRDVPNQFHFLAMKGMHVYYFREKPRLDDRY